MQPGGGADLFAGAFILRAHRRWPSHLVHGAPIHVTSIDTTSRSSTVPLTSTF